MRWRAVLILAGVVAALGGQAAVASLASAGSSPTAYVVNGLDGTVTPIDTATNMQGTPIPAGNQNEDVAIAITPDGKTAYVVNSPTTYGNGTLTPIDLATGTAGTPIAAGLAPDALAITPDGKTIYVANGNSTTGPGGVTPISTATHTAGPAIPSSGLPDAVAITPDGKTVYVVCANGTVTPVNTATNTAGTPITVGTNALGAAITPDGKTLYVADSANNTVTPISTATNTAGTPIAVGTRPIAIAITPNGKTAYVANDGPPTPFGGAQQNSTVTPVNTTTNTAGAAITVGYQPVAIAVTPDGQTVYVVNLGEGTVTPIGTATNTAGTQIQVGNSPIAIAITPAPASGPVPGAPKLSGLHVSPRTISVAGRTQNGHCAKPTAGNTGAHPCRRAVRTRVSYALSASATVTITIKRLSNGRKVGGKCVKPSPQTQTDGHCILKTSLPGQIIQSEGTGHHQFTFNGQIGGQALGPGSYELIAALIGGAPQRTTFRITA